MIKRLPQLLFITALLVIGLFNSYETTTFLPPVSLHAWRQADGASFALNYYKEGMNFFKPELHNLSSDDFTSGAGVSEAPIIYYITAILYKIVGQHDLIPRSINLIIVFLALFYLFKRLNHKLESPYSAAFIAMIPFTSATFCYFANGIIPDFTSFAFILLAGVQFELFLEKQQRRHILFFFVSATLAGLLKITQLIPFIALIILFIITLFLNKKHQIFKFRIIWLIGFCSSILILAGWYAYALHYNNTHNTSYFANEIHPAFIYSWQEFKSILNQIWIDWQESYFHRWMYYFIPLSLIATLMLIRKNLLFVLFSLSMVLGTILYFILWFEKFIHHDYYIAPFFPMIIVLAVGLFLSIKNYFPKVNVFIEFVLLLLLIYPILDSSATTRNRYKANSFDYYDWETYRTIGKMMKEKGIDRNTRVISPNDVTNAVTLYLMDMKGWTQCGMSFSPPDMVKLLDKGASFLITKGSKEQNGFIMPLLFEHEFLSYNNVYVWDLREIKPKDLTFDLDTITSNLEEITENPRMIKTSSQVIFLGNENFRTKEKSYSGEFSIKIDNTSPYGLTTTLPQINPGDSLYFKIRKLGAPDGGYLIIHDHKNQFNWDTNCKTSSNSIKEWQLFEYSFKIPEDTEPIDVVFFFYNPTENPIFLDDLEIMRKKKSKP